jgi:hypothetical protein
MTDADKSWASLNLLLKTSQHEHDGCKPAPHITPPPASAYICDCGSNLMFGLLPLCMRCGVVEESFYVSQQPVNERKRKR